MLPQAAATGLRMVQACLVQAWSRFMESNGKPQLFKERFQEKILLGMG